PWWPWRHIDSLTMIMVADHVGQLDRRRRVYNLDYHPIIRGDSFRRVGVIGKIGVQRPPLRSFRRLAGLRYRHQDWSNALRPLTSVHALLPLALKLGKHRREPISVAYRGRLRVPGHRSPSLRLAMVLVASQVAHADAKSCRPTQYPKAPM